MSNPINTYFSFTRLCLKGISLLAISLSSPMIHSECESGSSILSPELRTLDFDTAVSRTLDQSLLLRQANHEIQGKKSLVTQARLYPNPEFEYELETSELGWRERQEVYALSQLIELGGKRQKRIQFTTYEYYAALVGYEVSQLERLNQLSKAFIRVVAAQELSQLAINHQVNAREALNLINLQVEAGKASIMQQHKAQAAHAFANLNLRKALVEFRTAKNHLALLWASTCPDFDAVVYPFFDIAKPLPLEEYLSKLCQQPEVVQSLHRYMAAYHNLRFKKAERIPDVTLTLGYSNDKGDKGLVAGVNFPLPIWNQNQGNIRKAYYDMLKVNDEGRQLWLFLKNKLSNAYLELTQAYQDAEELKVMLQASSEALALAHEGYREGKLQYREILDAQKFFFEVREKYIQALVLYHQKRAEMDYLNSQTS